MYDITAQIVQEMGGADQLPQATLNLVRVFASICVQLEGMDAKVARGEAINHAHYVKLSSTLVRVAARISARRAARKVDRQVAALRRRADAAERAKREPADPGPVAVPSVFGRIEPLPGDLEGSAT
jgi:hypothetical protein